MTYAKPELANVSALVAIKGVMTKPATSPVDNIQPSSPYHSAGAYEADE